MVGSEGEGGQIKNGMPQMVFFLIIIVKTSLLACFCHNSRNNE